MITSHQQILAALNGIVVTDVHGDITYINDTARQHMKFRARHLKGLHITEISKTFGVLLNDCLATGKTVSHRGFDLNHKQFEIDVFPMNGDGQALGVIFSFQEKFVLKTSQLDMTESQFLELQFETAFDFTELGIWIMDGEGVVLKVNPAAEKMIGIKSSEFVGKNIGALIEKGIMDQSLTLHILKSKRPITKLLHVVKTDKYVMSTGMPVFDKDGNIVLVVVNELDITTLKHLQGQLEELRVVADKYKDELSDLHLVDFEAHGIISESKEMKQVLNVALKLARFDVSNILILGESGTGKGLIAQFIHKNGKRKDKPFIQVNCAALPESLLEAELFGFEKGSFTGANSKGKIGLFEMAQNGTILLDEIGDMPLSLQSKLLKCLDDHEIMHIGGLKPIKINCTIVAATNRDLKDRVEKKKFRKDLFHRLNAFCIELPPLRERPEDIVALSNFFLDKYNRRYGLRKRLTLKAIHSLQMYDFPGNVRELKNILNQSVVIHEGRMLDEILPGDTGDLPEKAVWHPPLETGEKVNLSEMVGSFEKNILFHAIRQHKTTRKIAAYLGTSQSKVARMLKKYHMSTN